MAHAGATLNHVELDGIPTTLRSVAKVLLQELLVTNLDE